MAEVTPYVSITEILQQMMPLIYTVLALFMVIGLLKALKGVF